MTMHRTSANAEFFSKAGKHFVSVSYSYYPPDGLDERTGIVSGFVVLIEDVWFYVTAGHVIREIEEGFKQGGRFDYWRFDDQTAGGKFGRAAVPFHFDLEEWFSIDRDGMDYAVTIIDGLPRANLEAGGVVPIANWVNGPDEIEHDQLILVGIPAETVSNKEGMIEARVLMTPFKLIDPPPNADGVGSPRYFGQLQLEGPNEPKVTDIRGMSGGPIFAFKRFDGIGKYRIVGLQSSWYQKSRTIIFCSFGVLADALRLVMKNNNN